jgi:esterase/lipase
MGTFFNDKQFSFQFLRLLGSSISGAADANEVISTAEKIKEGDFESWCSEWSKLADRLKAFADECRIKGHKVSSRQAYLRACNYYRAAEFYLHENQNDSRKEKLYNSSLECFSYVMQFNETVIEGIKIPYENTYLPAHFYVKDNSPVKRPVLIAMTGYDGTKEEFYGLAMTALKHGMNCIAFEGPGQGEVIHKQNIPFRYDYEKVVTAVIDYLYTRKEVDTESIVLWGQSFGGYLAPRAAAFEHRMAACVANSGVYDFMGFRRPKNMEREEYFRSIKENMTEANVSIIEAMKENTELRWAIQHGMYVLGAQSPAEYMVKCEPYYMEGIAEKIQCPTLIVDSEKENYFPGQAKELYDRLICEKKFISFTTDQCAEYHCQVGAKLISGEIIFNWIDDILKAN